MKDIDIAEIILNEFEMPFDEKEFKKLDILDKAYMALTKTFSKEQFELFKNYEELKNYYDGDEKYELIKFTLNFLNSKPKN